MSDTESLSSILAGSSAFAPAESAPAPTSAPDVKPAEASAPAAAPSAAPETAPSEPAKAASVRDENGRFTSKAEPVKEAKPEPMVPLSALLAERAKRKEPEAAPKPKVSIFEDEDRGITDRVVEQIAPLRETVLAMSLRLARQEHPDFDEVAEAFKTHAENDPSGKLWQAMQADPDPAGFVYRVGKQVSLLAPFNGDVAKYGEQVSAEARAELTKERENTQRLAAEVEALKKQLADLQNLPRSLNSAPASAAPKDVADTDDDDISKIVRFGTKR